MIDGLYSAANGMFAQQGRIDSISNDLANVNTNGYKSLRYHFSDLLYTRMGNHRAITDQSETGAGVKGTLIGRNLAQGTLNRTDQPFDLAIQGPGYFQVRTRDGQLALTRDGSFKVDVQGRLVTANGEFLVPTIQIPRGTDPAKISINQAGDVKIQGGRTLGQINLVSVTSPENMQPVGENLFLPTAASGNIQAAPAGGVLVQGALEGSNTDVAQSFSDMIEAQRAYDLSSRSVRTWDELLQTANQIRR